MPTIKFTDNLITAQNLSYVVVFLVHDWQVARQPLFFNNEPNLFVFQCFVVDMGAMKLPAMSFERTRQLHFDCKRHYLRYYQ